MDTFVWEDYPTTLERTLKIARGSGRMTVYSLKKSPRRSTSYPALSMVRTILSHIAWAHSDVVSVWCWGWDGSGDLDGPDVDPIWEPVSRQSVGADPVQIRHRRDFKI